MMYAGGFLHFGGFFALRRLRPSRYIVDPTITWNAIRSVVAAARFSHQTPDKPGGVLEGWAVTWRACVCACALTHTHASRRRGRTVRFEKRGRAEDRAHVPAAATSRSGK